jgi:ATP-binding protein involved in chromosome partitioning
MVNLKREISPKYWELARAGEQQAIEPVEAYGLRIMSTGFIWAERDPFTLAGGMLSALLHQFLARVRWGELDFLFVDLPPGTADLPQTVAKMFSLAGAVVVVTPQDVAHLDGRKAVAMLRTAGVRVLGGVQNMDGLACPHCKETIEVLPRVRADRSIWSLGVERIGEIPMDPAVSFGGDLGRPLLVEHPDSPTAWAFRRAATLLRAALER